MHVADATGRAILKPLLDRVSRNHNVSIAQGTECISLLKSGSRVVGARFRNITRDEFDVLAPNVIMASGGLGGLYEESTNPSILTGDGIALAYDAGAEIENLEFVQFHPTVFFAGRSQARFKQRNFLITEAVRGAGALLRNINGELFAQNYHPDAELATRDIVSRAIIAEMKATGADCVFLDMRAIPRETLLSKFPNVYQTCRDYGYKLEQDLLPVRPAAHYTIGGIKTDINGRTNVDGLWALGECASNGLHGANRLASNSLLECIVVSDFVATDVLACDRHPERSEGSLANSTGIVMPSSMANVDVKAVSNYPECHDLDEIRSILDKHVSLERSIEGLNYAYELISKLAESAQRTTTLLLIASARERQESRGTHYRSDFPNTSIEFEYPTIITKPSLTTHHV
jgi:L-aspartate oxidase